MPTTSSPSLQVDALDAAGVAAHGAGVGLVEADRHAVLACQDDLVARLRQDHADERVALVEADADDAAVLGPAVLLSAVFFTSPCASPSAGSWSLSRSGAPG